MTECANMYKESFTLPYDIPFFDIKEKRIKIQESSRNVKVLAPVYSDVWNILMICMRITTLKQKAQAQSYLHKSRYAPSPMN